MNCKFCNAQLEEGMTVCPSCGRDLTEAPAEPEAPPEAMEPVEAEAAQEPAEEIRSQETDGAEEAPAEEAPQPEKRKLSPGRLAIIAVCGVLLLGILAAAILLGSGVELGPQGEGILYKSSYTVDDTAAVRQGGKVVARVNGKELTNAGLQAHYFGYVYQFMDSYGTSYFNYAAPLDGQSFDDAGMTWQQYFLDIALLNWHRYQILEILAAQEGFQPELDDIETLRQELEAAAAEYGFESADAMVQSDMGAGCTLEDYLDYISLIQSGNQFVTYLTGSWEITEEDLEAFYTENEAEFIEAGLDKNSGNIVDVRHLLIMPKGEKGENGYTEDQWKEALAEAEKLLAQWKAGAATEESFAALATEYTEDGGSKSTGGLYTGITPYSSYVPNFLSWSVDPARQVGDTGIVETEYGYHIMYFVGGEPLWKTAARDNIPTYKLNALIEENEELYPVEILYRNIVVTDANVAESE